MSGGVGSPVVLLQLQCDVIECPHGFFHLTVVGLFSSLTKACLSGEGGLALLSWLLGVLGISSLFNHCSIVSVSFLVLHPFSAASLIAVICSRLVRSRLFPWYIVKCFSFSVSQYSSRPFSHQLYLGFPDFFLSYSFTSNVYPRCYCFPWIFWVCIYYVYNCFSSFFFVILA